MLSDCFTILIAIFIIVTIYYLFSFIFCELMKNRIYVVVRFSKAIAYYHKYTCLF